jgi:glucosamine--fructose-6-phosphate aminotransferase (isomerizing)
MSADDLRARLDETTTWREATLAADALAGALAVARDAPPLVLDCLASATRIVLAGAGSSYYVAQIVAAALRDQAYLGAVAAPLSEVILRPEAWLSERRQGELIVIVSRSGTTTEAVGAARQLRDQGRRTLAVTCRAQSPLASATSDVLVVPADETSIVMTRSFGAMTVVLLRLIARLMRGDMLAADLDRVPDAWQAAADLVGPALALADAAPSRVVVLGGGPALGLANEVVLKITETSQVPANAWEPMEFRHGPISVCEPGVLVIGLINGPAAATEARVLDEAAALGATTWCPVLPGEAGMLGAIAQLPLLLLPLQAFAFGLAIRRGLDPDRPRHLNQVVVLDDA